MSRKIFAILAIMGLLLAQPCFGETNLIKHYNLSNDTAQEATMHVSISTIIPNQARIFGFTVCPTRSHSYSSYAALYDESSTSTHLSSNLFGEAEAATGTTDGDTFPYPKNLSNGLTIALGPYSEVIVYYTK